MDAVAVMRQGKGELSEGGGYGAAASSVWLQEMMRGFFISYR